MRLLEILNDFFRKILPNKSHTQSKKSKTYLKLTRAVWQSNQIAKSTGLIRPKLFLPVTNKETGVFETSVANINNMSETNIWPHIGKYIMRGKPYIGRADFPGNEVIKIGLKLRHDSKPKRHVAITGWPETKHEQLSMAQDFVEFTSLIQKQ